MSATVIRGRQVLDGTIQRADLDTTTVGQAVTAKLIQGSNITLSSTGADAGTGDVTVSAATDTTRYPMTGGPLNGQMNVNPPAGTIALITGKKAPVISTEDFLQFQAQGTSTGSDGSAIALLGPGYPGSPGAVQVYAGTNAGFKTTVFNTSGTVTLAADPSVSMDATTKQYVDSRMAATTTTAVASFTVPASGSTTTVTVVDASWIIVGQPLFFDTAGGGAGLPGWLIVTAKAGNLLTVKTP